MIHEYCKEVGRGKVVGGATGTVRTRQEIATEFKAKEKLDEAMCRI